MPIDLETLVGEFEEFESELIRTAPRGVFESVPRSVNHLLGRFAGYAGVKFEVHDVNLTDPSSRLQAASDIGLVVVPEVNGDELGSIVLIPDSDQKRFGVKILLNSGQDKQGKPFFNHCYRRFLLMKESVHVVLRTQFRKRGLDYTDTGSAVVLTQTLDRLLYLPFAIVDFDDNSHPDDVKIEHAAELLGFLLLYPLDDIDRDRRKFLELLDVTDFEEPEAIATRSLEYARRYEVPQRYVDLLFRWSGFDNLYSIYCERRTRRNVGF